MKGTLLCGFGIVVAIALLNGQRPTGSSSVVSRRAPTGTIVEEEAGSSSSSPSAAARRPAPVVTARALGNSVSDSAGADGLAHMASEITAFAAAGDAERFRDAAETLLRDPDAILALVDYLIAGRARPAERDGIIGMVNLAIRSYAIAKETGFYGADFDTKPFFAALTERLPRLEADVASVLLGTMSDEHALPRERAVELAHAHQLTCDFEGC